jgi:hypothetical protein
LNELSFVRSVCGELRNQEMFEKTLTGTEDELKARLALFSGFDGKFDMDVGIIASHFYSLSVSDLDQANLSVLEAIFSDSRLAVRDEDFLFDFIHRRASDDLSYFGLLEFVRFEFVSADCMAKAIDFISSSFESFNFGIWSSLRTRLALPVTPPLRADRLFAPKMDSKIVSEVPEMFSVFGERKKLQLLYRGSRDGFEAKAFHSRCDGHPNTVSLILSKNNCIFGGYTPLAWGSGNGYVADPSLTSFIFTIKNPHGLPPQICKQKQQDSAIYGSASYGPVFGNNHDLKVRNPFQGGNSNYSNLGSVYANETGIGGHLVLTGEEYFVVEEIEVFQII